jgi:hypothetical protein
MNSRVSERTGGLLRDQQTGSGFKTWRRVVIQKYRSLTLEVTVQVPPGVPAILIEYFSGRPHSLGANVTACIKVHHSWSPYHFIPCFLRSLTRQRRSVPTEEIEFVRVGQRYSRWAWQETSAGCEVLKPCTAHARVARLCLERLFQFIFIKMEARQRHKLFGASMEPSEGHYCC